MRPVPTDDWPSSVFAKLFLEGRPEEVKAQARRLADGQSVLDAVRDQARKLERGLAQATAKSSMSISPASASWSSGWHRPPHGQSDPSPRSVRSLPSQYSE